ncbi:FAD-binding protein [Propionimicrobium sp. PCR01-08-3]|uniref:FAD-binding protein n=1 Tax=Propionimicrobium sp. PCR01-08-3 TaxID=3052086 RepID=UPI00255C5816|nr:FAD-binding protein [Propionimicrobium sp. PCR01-08-3]WIY83041.1 FAD-binding protein [Propionimicrobium sp. PCR01-08-3]
MSENVQETYDVVVVGSGAAAFATALAAVDEQLSVIMVESTDQWGGNTSMSGGGMWLPNNPLMRREGAGDSREEALEYMLATIGEPGPASSKERIEAFVDSIDDFVLTAERHGMEFMRDTDYPDYYPELPGGKIGRAIEGMNFDIKKLGDWAATQRGVIPLPVRTNDIWLLGRAWSTPDGFMRGAQFVFRTIGGLVAGKKLVGLGGALAAQYAHAVLVKARVPLLLSTPAVGLEIDGERVVGVRVQDAEGERVLRARRGVMLGAGGFESNQAWRRNYQNVIGYTSGSPGNLGKPIEFAQEIGAAVDYMDDAWWGATLAPFNDGPAGGFLVGERALPYMMIVDGQGRRFANEAESYIDLGHHMNDHDRGGSYWMITEGRYNLRYFRTFSIQPGLIKGMTDKAFLHKARTLGELARKLGVPQENLRVTVERFNGFARTGRDQDFHKGDSAYDRYYGDPTVRPNPCLGPLEKGPFTAYKIVAGDLGTKGGLITDKDARVLREDGSVIEGLYAAGNTTATVMGHTYPGPGSTIAPAAVFGLRGGRHMARQA